jgi:hypothetical protein
LWEPLSWWDNEKRLAARREMGPQRFSGPQATWWGGFKLLAAAAPPANIAIVFSLALNFRNFRAKPEEKKQKSEKASSPKTRLVVKGAVLHQYCRDLFLAATRPF